MPAHVSVAKFCPDYRAHSVLDITSELLIAHNIRLICFDLDNCLLPYGGNTIDRIIERHVLKLDGHDDWLVYIVSNTCSSRRVRDFAEKYNFGYVVPGLALWRWKPSPWCLHEAMRKMCMDRESPSAIMIGDQLSDVQAGKQAGFITILVDPLTDKCHPLTRRYKLPKQQQRILALEQSGLMPPYLPHVSIEPP